jgi:tetratricopeptide (TPR) repeat protein
MDLYRGRTSASLAVIAKATATDAPWGPTFNALLILNAAQTSLAIGQPQQALSLAERARTTPGQTLTTPRGLSRYVLALALTRLGRAEDARVPIDEIAARAKATSVPVEMQRVHQLAGALALDRHDTATAVAELLQAEALMEPRSGFAPPPTQPPTWFALGSAYLAAGNDGESEKRFVRLVTGSERVLFPIEYVRSLYCLGQIAERRGDRAKAHEYYQQFVDRWGDGDIDREHVAAAKAKLAAR